MHPQAGFSQLAAHKPLPLSRAALRNLAFARLDTSTPDNAQQVCVWLGQSMHSPERQVQQTALLGMQSMLRRHPDSAPIARQLLRAAAWAHPSLAMEKLRSCFTVLAAQPHLIKPVRLVRQNTSAGNDPYAKAMAAKLDAAITITATGGRPILNPVSTGNMMLSPAPALPRPQKQALSSRG